MRRWCETAALPRMALPARGVGAGRAAVLADSPIPVSGERVCIWRPRDMAEYAGTQVGPARNCRMFTYSGDAEEVEANAPGHRRAENRQHSTATASGPIRTSSRQRDTPRRGGSGCWSRELRRGGGRDGSRGQRGVKEQHQHAEGGEGEHPRARAGVPPPTPSPAIGMRDPRRDRHPARRFPFASPASFRAQQLRGCRAQRWSPFQDQRGMRKPSGTSSADSW
jgi:hypothetical protein